jgi:hypothetical protein
MPEEIRVVRDGKLALLLQYILYFYKKQVEFVKELVKRKSWLLI